MPKLTNSHSTAFFTRHLPPAQSLLTYFDESSLFKSIRTHQRCSRSRTRNRSRSKCHADAEPPAVVAQHLDDRASELTKEIDAMLGERAVGTVDDELIACLDENAFYELKEPSDVCVQSEEVEQDRDSANNNNSNVLDVDEIIQEIEDELFDRRSSQSSLASSTRASSTANKCPCKCKCMCHIKCRDEKSTSNSPASSVLGARHRSMLGGCRTRSNSNRLIDNTKQTGSSNSYNCSQNSLEWDLGADLRAAESTVDIEHLDARVPLQLLLDPNSKLVDADNYAEHLEDLLDVDDVKSKTQARTKAQTVNRACPWSCL